MKVSRFDLKRYKSDKQVSNLKIFKGKLFNSGLIEVEEGKGLYWSFLKENDQKVVMSARSARASFVEKKIIDLWQPSSIERVELLKQAQIISSDYIISGSHIFYYPHVKRSNSEKLVTIKRASSFLSASNGFRLNVESGGAELFGPIQGVLQNYSKR